MITCCSLIKGTRLRSQIVAACFLVPILSQPAYPIEQGPAAPSDVLDPECYAAFLALPIDKYGNPYEIDDDGHKVEPPTLEVHFENHPDQYARYDRACFVAWDGLKSQTKAFLANNVGALFTSQNDAFCTATRITDDLIITAHHCSEFMEGSTFRLYGFPNQSIKVIKEVEIRRPSIPDLDDFGVWRIEATDVPFTFTKQSFTRSTLPHQAITIVAISILAKTLFVGEAMDKWRDAVRWSRTKSAQVWPVEEVSPEVEVGARSDECLFHKMPTFPGMSGAPIITVRWPVGAPPRFFVAGIHLRNGVDIDRADGCGEHGEFNIGIRIPSVVMDLINEKD
ncbi:hypothetical protein FJ937_06925 [Mesorhizobium sp. B2-4-4]|nr:hypothetical protein FJ937_06925 [Mesorhizobium sp. B2-4-4]